MKHSLTEYPQYHSEALNNPTHHSQLWDKTRVIFQHYKVDQCPRHSKPVIMKTLIRRRWIITAIAILFISVTQ